METADEERRKDAEEILMKELQEYKRLKEKVCP